MCLPFAILSLLIITLFYEFLDVGKCLLVFGHMLPVTSGASSPEVMVKVVDLHSQCDLVSRLADVLHVIHVGGLLVMSQQLQRVDDPLRESFCLQSLEGPVGVLYQVVKHTHESFIIVLACTGYGAHV